jgi:predicted Fe-Mo cluster-binding NifX family protein
MKLCITSRGKELEAKIDTTFGRAPYFLIIDTDTNVTEVVENTAVSQGHGAGIAAAQLVSDIGVDGVLSGYVGPNAFEAFRAAGIKLFVGVSGQDSVKEALAKFHKGEYREASTPVEVAHCGQGRGRGLGRGKGRCGQA